MVVVIRELVGAGLARECRSVISQRGTPLGYEHLLFLRSPRALGTCGAGATAKRVVRVAGDRSRSDTNSGSFLTRWSGRDVVRRARRNRFGGSEIPAR